MIVPSGARCVKQTEKALEDTPAPRMMGAMYAKTDFLRLFDALKIPSMRHDERRERSKWARWEGKSMNETENNAPDCMRRGVKERWLHT